MIRVPLMRDAFLNDAETRARLAEFVKSAPRLSMGDKCAEFEEAFAGWQGRKHAILVNSGSSANLALVQAAINLGWYIRGCGVGVSALTWATNAMPLTQLGMLPIPVDVSPETFASVPPVGYDCARWFLTNPLGFSAVPWRQHHVFIDNCEALGTEMYLRPVYHHSSASTFSFFVGHHLSTIEGGMVCCDDADLADMLRMVRAHGWDRNLEPAKQTALRAAHGVDLFMAPYTFYVPGYNLRPTEITGFLGLTQLPLMDAAIDRRQAIYERLAAVKCENPDFLRHDRRHIKRLSAFCVPLVCRTPALRAQYVAVFKVAGVEVRPLIAGNIQRQPFWKAAGLPVYPTPGADMLHDCGFYCAVRPDMTEEELSIVEGCLA